MADKDVVERLDYAGWANKGLPVGPLLHEAMAEIIRLRSTAEAREKELVERVAAFEQALKPMVRLVAIYNRVCNELDDGTKKWADIDHGLKGDFTQEAWTGYMQGRMVLGMRGLVATLSPSPLPAKRTE